MLSEFASKLFMNDKKRYLEKIIGVGNQQIYGAADSVLLLVQRADIIN